MSACNGCRFAKPFPAAEPESGYIDCHHAPDSHQVAMIRAILAPHAFRPLTYRIRTGEPVTLAPVLQPSMCPVRLPV
jgi:hypothetical protein